MLCLLLLLPRFASLLRRFLPFPPQGVLGLGVGFKTAAGTGDPAAVAAVLLLLLHTEAPVRLLVTWVTYVSGSRPTSWPRVKMTDTVV